MTGGRYATVHGGDRRPDVVYTWEDVLPARAAARKRGEVRVTCWSRDVFLARFAWFRASRRSGMSEDLARARFHDLWDVGVPNTWGA